MSRFYITTPIYYVNAAPHLGTFYTTVVADAFARFHRAIGDDTFFLTGLDEHGQKIERIARERGMEPQIYCDGIAGQFTDTWKRAGISNDAFVRTSGGATRSDGTEIARHADAVAELWRRMASAVDNQGRPDIYEAEYDGMYCVGCEEWKSEDDVVEEKGEKVCPIHRRPVERVKEKNWFFRLSRYADYLLGLYDKPDFVRPESRRNEVASFVRGGLKDISVSRLKKSVGWAIPVPGDDDHTVYVWIDALTNYLTALGGPNAVASGGNAGATWAASHHLIAKDILRFHAVYWPAMLKSAGLPPPGGVFCHGYLTVKGQKISKSLPATKVDPNVIAEDLGWDALRYFVLREYTLGGDGDFTYEALLQRYESDLGNDLGNLLNRTISMVLRYIGPDLPARPTESHDFASTILGETNLAWGAFKPSSALESIWKLVRFYNQGIDQSKPWVLAKDPAKSDELRQVLSHCCEALRWTALLVAPAMPRTSRAILHQLGRAADQGTWPAQWGWPGATLMEPTPLFPRLDPERKAALIAKWLPPDAAALPPTEPPTSATRASTPAEPTPIDKADFDRVELRAAKVLACERVPKTDKLLKLTLDIGTEQRTVVSGIAGAYDPETLVGRGGGVRGGAVWAGSGGPPPLGSFGGFFSLRPGRPWELAPAALFRGASRHNPPALIQNRWFPTEAQVVRALFPCFRLVITGHGKRDTADSSWLRPDPHADGRDPGRPRPAHHSFHRRGRHGSRHLARVGARARRRGRKGVRRQEEDRLDRGLRRRKGQESLRQLAARRDPGGVQDLSGRHQGAADDADRRRHSVAERRDSTDAGPVRLPAPGALFHRRPLAGQAPREGRHGDLPREHRGHLRRHRMGRGIARGPEDHRVPAKRDGREEDPVPGHERHRHQAGLARRVRAADPRRPGLRHCRTTARA